MENKKLRVGFVGCGDLMQSRLALALELSELCDFTATCDVDIERAKDAAQFVGAPYYTTDYRELLDYVDAVITALPHDLHHPIGKFFAENGKHVFMEKPLCETEEECVDLINTAEKAGVVLFNDYPIRYFAGIYKMKELLDSNEYGQIIQMSIWTEQFTDPYYQNQHKTKPILWLTKPGNGTLFAHGCHYIDLLLWFLGSPETGVHMGTKNGTPWLAEEGTSNVVMKFKNGATGYYFGTWGARGTMHGYTWEVQTDKGTFWFTCEDNKLRFRREYDPYNKEEKEIVWSFTVDSFGNQSPVAHFIDCVINNKKPMTDGVSALKSLRVIWKLYEAEKNGVLADLRGLGYDD